MNAAYIQANTNGNLHAANKPSVSPLDRGFLYGDAIYEVWRTYRGVIFAWDEHWGRLERSAVALGMPLPLAQAEALHQIRRAAAKFHQQSGVKGDLYVRLQISRGAGRIGLNPGLADHPNYVLLIQQLKTTSPKKNRARSCPCVVKVAASKSSFHLKSPVEDGELSQ